jgi:hypothetical protein
MVSTIFHLDTGVRHVIRMINDYFEEVDENENEAGQHE